MKIVNTIIVIISFIILLISMMSLSQLPAERIEGYWYIIISLSLVISSGMIIAPKYLKNADPEKHTRIKILALLSEVGPIDIKEFHTKYKNRYKFCEEETTSATLYNMLKENDIIIQNNSLKIKDNI